MAKNKIKEIPLTYVEAADGYMAKFEYRNHYILVRFEEGNDDYEDNYIAKIFDKNMRPIDDDDFGPIENYGLEDARDDAAIIIDDIVEKPQRAREALKECDTKRLKDIFYSYATSAPCWADEVMGLVAEAKLRKWLIAQIIDMLSDEELIEEML
jgi:hypothetical protein